LTESQNTHSWLESIVNECNGDGTRITTGEMSLFVDKVITRDDSAIQVEMCWHPQMGLLARGKERTDTIMV
jgi:hypothetical protein